MNSQRICRSQKIFISLSFLQSFVWAWNSSFCGGGAFHSQYLKGIAPLSFVCIVSNNKKSVSMLISFPLVCNMLFPLATFQIFLSITDFEQLDYKLILQVYSWFLCLNFIELQICVYSLHHIWKIFLFPPTHPFRGSNHMWFRL